MKPTLYKATLPAENILKDATLEVEISVKGIRVYRLRLWLATRLFLLAARLLNCGIEFKSGEE